MSVVPLRIPDDAKAPRKVRDPRGTVNIAYGYRLSQEKPAHTNVKSTTIKGARSPGAGPRTKFQANPVRESLNGQDPTVKDKPRESMHSKESAIQNEQTRTSRARSSTKNEPGKSSQDAPLVRTSNPGQYEKRKSLRNANHSRKEESLISILPGNVNVEIDERKAREEREYNNSLRTKDFVETTDKRIRKKKIRSLVDEGKEFLQFVRSSLISLIVN